MDFVKLMDEQRAFFDEEAYLVVEDVLNREEIERFTEACDAVMADFDSNGQTIKQTRAGMVLRCVIV